MTRLTDLEAVINSAPPAGVGLTDLAATFPDAGTAQVAPLAWWLAHTRRVAMSPDATRWRPLACTAACGVRLDPVLAAQGWTRHPGCEAAA